MMRAIVLVLCLASAGGIAVYAHYSSGETGEPVYTVPARAPDPAPKPPAPAAPKKPIDPADRTALTRELQRELKRVGCYSGQITGVWTTSSRMAMKAFNERVNAALPIDNPDPVLLSLVQGYQSRACGAACPAGQTAAGGACVPNAVLAKASKTEDQSETEKAGAALPAAGAAAALAGAATASKADPKAPAPPGAAGPGAVTQNGPVPPEGVRERLSRRSAEAPPRPPKVVRDFLRALGFK